MIPGCSYPASFEQGNVDWSVWALKINVNAWRRAEGLSPLLDETATFGQRTEDAVRTIQRRRNLRIDGLAGPVTQKRLALDLMLPVAKLAGIDRCVLRGFTALEAGYLVAAVNCQGEGRAGKDCGWNQWRVYDDEATEQMYRDAFYGPSAFKRTAELLMRRAQELGSMDYAILAHNWWAAAFHYGKGDIKTWVYTSRGKQYGMDDSAPWIVEKDIDGVATGYDWSDFYVGRVKRYCG